MRVSLFFGRLDCEQPDDATTCGQSLSPDPRCRAQRRAQATSENHWKRSRSTRVSGSADLAVRTKRPRRR